ncbi:MAG: VOC family protein [Pseudomonadota bacterium]
MGETSGLNHPGLSVLNLDETRDFFVRVLGWTETGRDDSYPRTAVSDDAVRLTLWEVDQGLDVQDFHRRRNIGLHHLALEVESEAKLDALSRKVRDWPGVTVEFMPELVGRGPRKHMMFAEPGGIRLELIWPGA